MHKIKFILVIIVIILVWLLSYILHQRMSNPSLDVRNIYLEHIKSIKIDDRGVLGNKSVKILDAKKVKYLSKLIIASSKANCDTINFKDNGGLCLIELQLNDGKNLVLVMAKTNLSGGILRSGDFCYSNDSLLKVITNIIDSQ